MTETAEPVEPTTPEPDAGTEEEQGEEEQTEAGEDMESTVEFPAVVG